MFCVYLCGLTCGDKVPGMQNFGHFVFPIFMVHVFLSIILFVGLLRFDIDLKPKRPEVCMCRKRVCEQAAAKQRRMRQQHSIFIYLFASILGFFKGAQPVSPQGGAGAAPFLFQCQFVSVSSL